MVYLQQLGESGRRKRREKEEAALEKPVPLPATKVMERKTRDCLKENS
ncbi:MAG: hypothetical protein ACJAWP_001673 [Porticoccus sp.]|jgi:hypothetical protein|tara:strand:+ start:133 stop:276 length:144 start_codon:yes stop_codon:yes gene_type:complete